MAEYIATSASQFETYAEAAAPGDVVRLVAGTHGSISISDLAGTASQPIILTIAEGLNTAYVAKRNGLASPVIIDGGKGSIIDDLLAENFVSEATTDANTSCFKISTSEHVIIIGFEVKNEGRGIHTDRCNGIFVSGIYAHRLWDRGIGGYTDNLTTEDIIYEDCALENYNNRLLDITGDASGWPAAGVGVYRDGDGTPSHNMIVRRAICLGNCWGESIAPFHCDGAIIEDCYLIDCSHTVGIYLDQCRNVTCRNNFIIATSNSPVRENNNGSTRLLHIFLLAREGSSFPYSSTGHVIHNNIGVGGQTFINGWNDLEDAFGATVTHNTGVYCVSDAITFDDFATPPTIVCQWNIFDSINVSNPSGFTFEDNWVIDGLPAYVTAGNGNFTTPDPVFANPLNEVNPAAEDYIVTNMVAAAEIYGALIVADEPDPEELTTSARSVGAVNQLTINVPGGATSGNKWLLAGIASREYKDDSVLTGPAGWTLLATVSPPTVGANGRLDVYGKQATGAEPASYTWNLSVSKGMCGIMRVVNDIDVENAIVDIKTANGEDTNQATGTSVTTLQPNAPVYYFGMVNSTSTDFTNDMSGWNKILEVETGGDEFLSCAMFTQTKTAAGATGAMTSTLTDATKEFAIVTLAFGVPVEDEATEGSNPNSGGGVQVTLDSVPFDYVLSTPQTKIQVMLGDV